MAGSIGRKGARTNIGSDVLVHESVESTNKTAALLAGEGRLAHGTVVLAHAQTAGRGQRGRSWSSQPGKDLTFTLLLEPQTLLVQDQYQISQLLSLSILDVLTPMLPGRVRVKWPNDILVDRLKVAGMLIKNEVAGDLVQRVLAGVGLNVNSRGHEEVLLATSLARETGREHDLKDLLAAICRSIQARWEQWEEGDRSPLVGFRDALWSRGRWADVELDGVPCRVRPMDVDGYGRLLVEEEGGRVAAYGTDRLRFGAR